MESLNTPKIIKNVNWSYENYEAITRLAEKSGLSFTTAVNLIINEWRRVNPTGIIKIGGNGSDHETAN